MTTDDLEGSIIGELETLGPVSAVVRQQVSDYARHAREVERLDVTLQRMTPGAPDYKRVSTAKAREARARDTAARHAGLTAALAKVREKPKPTIALHEIYEDLYDDDVLAGKYEISREEFERASDSRKERLLAGGLDVEALRSWEAVNDDEQRASLERAESDERSYERQIAAQSGVSIEIAWMRQTKVSEDEFARLFGRSPA